MTPTQNNGGDRRKKQQAPRWQEPERTQVVQTRGAVLEAQKRADAEARRQAMLRAGQLPPQLKKQPPARRQAPPPVRRVQRRRRRPMSVGEAIREELRDNLHGVGIGFSVNIEEVLRFTVCAALIVVNVLLQTTFFVRFSPFGAVPDLMLSLTAAVAVYEGEKWGAVTGLVSAFLIQCLGGSGQGPALLPLLYAPVGYLCGLLSKYYFNNSLPVKAAYILGCGVCKMFITMLTAMTMLGATLAEIILHIVIPEFFSTALLAPLVYFTVWLCLRAFHKSREERTEQS